MATLKSGGSAMIAGSVSGQVRDVDADLVMAVTAPPTDSSGASLIGYNNLTPDSNVFSGPLTGTLSISNSAGSRFCTSGSWTMRPK